MNITLNEIVIAFETRTMEALDGVPVEYVFSWQDMDVDAQEIMLLQAHLPGQVVAEEKGQGYLSSRVGVYKVTLSVPAETNPQPARNICNFIEGLFRGQYLYTKNGERIVCDEASTTEVGRDAETKRYIMFTDVPWRVFFND